jgi:hypothetical protein
LQDTLRPWPGRFSLRVVPWLALACILTGCGVIVRGVHHGVTSFRDSELFHQGRHGPLSEEEKEWAKAAWKYFENNQSPSTGLVGSVDMYPAASLWNIGDHLAAMIAAREMGLLTKRDFDIRLSQQVQFLNTMPLFMNALPNRLYNTASGRMVNYANQPEEIGWSAVDLGRLLLWLRIAAQRYPEYREYIEKAVLRFSFCEVVDACGGLHGGSRVHDRLQLFTEGQLGYEQYAALGFQAWGFNTLRASRIEPFARISIQGVEILYDARDPRETGGFAPVLTSPYVLDGLELNWDRVLDRTSPDTEHSDYVMADLARRVYAVQEARWRQAHVLTARTDHPLSQNPFFVYDSIFVAGYPWNTISDHGDVFLDKALVSTRAVFGLWALWRTGYTDELMSSTHHLYDPQRGWFEGRYERTGGYERTISCTTNAIVLESLLYKLQGKLFGRDTDGSYLKAYLADPFRHLGHCFPSERTGGPDEL